MFEPLPATAANYAGFVGSGDLAGLKAEREELTLRLRSLAAQLDELDRREAARSPLETSEPRDRAVIARRRGQLDSRLRSLVSRLTQLDRTLSSVKAQAPAVGVCPHCGYPSLDSGPCAYCLPFLAG